MPRFKDACGCYNKEDARELGLTAAVIWYDILNSSELFETNPIWYDQRKAGDRLGIPYQTISRAIKTLEESGRISVKVGYRPNSTIKTTWITILIPDLDEHQKSQNEISKKSQNEISILKEKKKEDTIDGDLPAVVYLKVNPSGRAWKSKKVYTTASEVERLEEMDDEDYIEFKHWMSPGMVGNDSRAKVKRMKVKLVQPDVVDDNEIVKDDGKKYKVIKGGVCY